MNNAHHLKSSRVLTAYPFSNQDGNLAFHPWRTLHSGSSEVGCFRLQHGSDYLKREMEFRPLVPLPLDQSKLGDYLERELEDFRVKIDAAGGVFLRLGANQQLGPIAGQIAFAYKLLLPKDRSKEEHKHGNEKQRI